MRSIDVAAAQSDAMLLGRRTYEEFAAFWSTQDRDEPMADYMNDTPKHIVSTTLTKLDWTNSSLVTGDIAETVEVLKRQPGKNIQTYGSPTLVGAVSCVCDRSCVTACSTSSSSLCIRSSSVPASDSSVTGVYGIALRLEESRTLDTGVLALTYAPATRWDAGA